MHNNIQIQYTAVESLIPYALNSRTHSDAQVAQIAASIRKFGFNNPVLIDPDGTIIAGHGRVLAAQKLKAQEVPTITLAHLSDAEKRAYVIADNKLALNAGWDEELLKAELDALRDEDFDLGLLGFDTDELTKAMGLDAELPEDDKPPVTDETRNLLLVECATERDLERLFEEMTERGLNVKIMS